MKKYLKNIFLSVGLFFLFQSLSVSAEAAVSDSLPRHWKASLNVEFKDADKCPKLTTQEWFKQQREAMTEVHKEKVLQPYMEESITTSNVAVADFYMFYVLGNNSKVEILSFPISNKRISISGQKKFKEELLKEAQLLIISGRSFEISKDVVSKSKIENGIRSDDIKQRINKIILGEIVLEGGHSEAYLLLELYSELSIKFGELAKANPTDQITVLGTLLTLASLKDPCEKNCFPMLTRFNSLLPKILPPMLPKSIVLAPALECLTLIAANEPHLVSDHLSTRSTRDSYESGAAKLEFKEKIVIDFTHPLQRIFSAQFKDLL